MPNANTPKLTDTQLIILSSAVQRDDASPWYRTASRAEPRKPSSGSSWHSGS